MGLIDTDPAPEGDTGPTATMPIWPPSGSLSLFSTGMLVATARSATVSLTAIGAELGGDWTVTVRVVDEVRPSGSTIVYTIENVPTEPLEVICTPAAISAADGPPSGLTAPICVTLKLADAPSGSLSFASGLRVTCELVSNTTRSGEAIGGIWMRPRTCTVRRPVAVRPRESATV